MRGFRLALPFFLLFALTAYGATQNADMLVRQMSELASTPELILLRGGNFDPAQGVPSEASRGLSEQRSANGGPELYIVQFTRSPQDEERALMNRMGAEMLYYIPNNAYLVRLNPDIAVYLPQSSLVRSFFRLPKWAKIDPLVSSPKFSTLEILVAPGRDGRPA